MGTRFSSRSRLGGLLLLAAAAAGCGGPKYHPVSGVVRLNGKPLAGAAVTLVPEGPGRPAAGVTDADGRYTLETGNAVGVPPGAYTAVVVKKGATATSADERTATAAPAPARPAVPERYAKPEESGLKVTVPAADPAGYDLALTSP